MIKRVKINKHDKVFGQKLFFKLLEEFINDSYSGRRLKKNGSRITNNSIDKYIYFKKIFIRFVTETNFDLKLYFVNHISHHEKEDVQAYWRKFYLEFTNYLYDKGYFDNYVGTMIKVLKTFFNYLIVDRNLDVGSYHKSFYAPCEEIPIITLTPEQLNYFIHNKELNRHVKEAQLEKIKDIFVFGCTVALRISDLLNLCQKNLITHNNCQYLTVKSQKTKTSSIIKLPDYAINILEKYKGKQETLLPKISKGYFDKQVKLLGKLLPDDFEIVKTRERKGEEVIVYKDPVKKIHFKLSDHISAHTMRRTAITNMLNLGMPEHVVRQISGHAPNSKEFFRYVKLSQSFLDQKTDGYFKKLNDYKL